MAIRLISYTLRKQGQNYQPILEWIKAQDWARITESSYAIDTELTPQQVYEILRPKIDANDELYITTMTGPWQSWGAEDVNDWLRRKLDTSARLRDYL